MAGQFSRGGTHDLVIGVDLEDVGSGASAHANAGLVHMIYGKSTGLTAADDQVFTIAATGLPGASDDAGFGAALRYTDAAGDDPSRQCPASGGVTGGRWQPGRLGRTLATPRRTRRRAPAAGWVMAGHDPDCGNR